MLVRIPLPSVILLPCFKYNPLPREPNPLPLYGSSVYLRTLGQPFLPIFPHFSQFFQARTTFSNLLNILKTTHLDISYNSFIIT